VKASIWLTMAMMGGVSLCSAQNLTRTDAMPGMTGAEFVQEGAPWRVSMGLVYKNWLYEHDALQQRVPSASDLANAWDEGDTDGSGWGLKAKIGKGDGHLNVIFMKSDFSYLLVMPKSRHQIDTVARDFELSWSQIRGRNNQAEWGSTLGFRYLGMQKDVEVTEGQMSVDGSGNMNWLMLVGGYDANWRPFDTHTFQAHGLIHFLLGEAKGTARSGADEDWTDGVVSETYGNEYSLAYGARAAFGVELAVTRDVRVTIDYMREWLYSFDATDTGIVVFPDNSDAMFIENHHGVVATLNYLF
jgi:hypothetical protein